MKNVNSF